MRFLEQRFTPGLCPIAYPSKVAEESCFAFMSANEEDGE